MIRVLALLVLCALQQHHPDHSYSGPYRFIQVDVPGAYATWVSGIDSAGEICGDYTLTEEGPTHAFIRSADGTFTTFDVPGSALTMATGINDHGQVSGGWSPTLNVVTEHAFLRDPSGAINTFDVPNYSINGANGINNAGQMTVNALEEPGPNVPLFRSASGVYTTITVAGFSSVYVYGLNDNGVAVGTCYGVGGLESAFLVTGAGAGPTATFTVPNSTTSSVAYAINDANYIVGTYTTGYRGGEVSHAFVRDSAGNFTTLEVPGARSAEAFAIANTGQIGGNFYDTNGRGHGFIASPHDRNQL